MGMESLSSNEFLEIVIYTLGLVGVVIFNCFFFLRAKQVSLVQYFFRLQALVAFWMVAKIFIVIAPNIEVMWFWYVIMYFGICYFSVELLAFSYIYKFDKLLPHKIHVILVIIASINYLVLFTNNFHHLIYNEIQLSYNTKGSYFYVLVAFTYILIFVSIYFLITSKANSNFSRKDKVVVSVGLFIPLLLNFGYISQLLSIGSDLTPITFNFMMLSFAFVAFRNNHYDLQMMTRLTILDNLYEAIVILDKDNRIIEFNKKIVEIISPVVTIEKYNKFEKVFESLEPFIIGYDGVVEVFEEFITSPLPESKSDVELVTSDGVKKHYVFRLQKTYSIHGEYSGSIIKFVDMSKYHTLMDELETKNSELQLINTRLNENISVKKRLVIEQERNRASKEVHDILGHSVTLVVSLLEMIRATYTKEPDFAKEKVTQAMEITRNGLNELKQSLTRKKDSSISVETLIEDLKHLTEEFKFSGVEVEFITNHYSIKIKPNYYDTIYRICQESLTNALRHGKASKITIAVRFSEHSVDIIIVDNGVGCKDCVKGNGLKGMEQRVKELDGFFSCGSPDGEGFNLHVTIPISRELSSINAVEII